MSWTHVKLGEIVTLRSGGTPSKQNSNYWNGSIPWVSCKDMKAIRLHDTEDHVTEDAVASGTRISPKGTVLIVVRGMILAKEFPIAVARRPVTFNQDLKAVIPCDSLDPTYLAYLLLGHKWEIRALADEAAHGTKRIQTDRFLNFQVPLPPLPTQRRIASILSAYDDLIENNTRRIAILEEMARRLYEEWFVHFRFPGHKDATFTETEQGLVPEGWEPKGLYDVAEVTYGHPFKSKQFNEEGNGLGVIRIRDIKGNEVKTFTEEEGKPKHLIENGDILIGMDGAFHMGKWAGGNAWLNQRVVRLRPTNGMSRYLLFLTTERPIKRLEETIVGTTVAHLSAKDLKAMEVLLPPQSLLKKITETLEPMYDLELGLCQKNANLRAQRDLLLPKLVSGEIDVSKAERTLEDAVA